MLYTFRKEVGWPFHSRHGKNVTCRLSTMLESLFRCRGFTMVEVLVAGMVIASMMVVLLNFVSYAGEIWQRGHINMTLSAEGNMLLEAIEREMNFATGITSPAVSATTNSIVFNRDVSVYCSTHGYETVNARFIIGDEGPDTTIASIAFIDADGTPGPPVNPFSPITTWSIGAADAHFTLNVDRFQYVLSRHINTLNITRVTTNRIEVEVVLRTKRAEDGFEKKVAFNRSIVIPRL